MGANATIWNKDPFLKFSEGKNQTAMPFNGRGILKDLLVYFQKFASREYGANWYKI